MDGIANYANNIKFGFVPAKRTKLFETTQTSRRVQLDRLATDTLQA